MSELSGAPGTIGLAASQGDRARAGESLRSLAIASGAIASLLFVLIGLRYGLQMYADGSLFSYAVAVRDAWAFHCHNISGRLAVYLFAFAPAEAYVQWAGDPAGGVALYGFLFFILQFLGLALTFAADRSPSRLLFCYACASTACFCPLVFGFPTEVWMMHALFWPTLAAAHFARPTARGNVSLFLLMVAIALTHAGALIALVAILMTLSMRGLRDVLFRRAAVMFALVVLIWAAVKLTLRPDDYTAAVLARAALHVFDLSILTGPLMRLIGGALLAYGALFWLFSYANARLAPLYAAAVTAAVLALYWLRFDDALHATNRYYLRTILLLATPALGFIAATHLLLTEGSVRGPLSFVARILNVLLNESTARAATGALIVILLIHAVETEKFLRAWEEYKGAVRTLAAGTVSDPALGSAQFVSSARIPGRVNALSWFSTTPFLSILLAPQMTPARLVVDPKANYFWISCETATENLEAKRAMPAQGRELVRAYSCLHRWRRKPQASTVR